MRLNQVVAIYPVLSCQAEDSFSPGIIDGAPGGSVRTHLVKKSSRATIFVLIFPGEVATMLPDSGFDYNNSGDLGSDLMIDGIRSSLYLADHLEVHLRWILEQEGLVRPLPILDLD